MTISEVKQPRRFTCTFQIPIYTKVESFRLLRLIFEFTCHTGLLGYQGDEKVRHACLYSFHSCGIDLCSPLIHLLRMYWMYSGAAACPSLGIISSISLPSFMLQSLGMFLFFYHPAVIIISCRHCRECESCSSCRSCLDLASYMKGLLDPSSSLLGYYGLP